MALRLPSLRKNFWVVPVPLLAVAAYLNAQAVTQLVGVGMSVDEKLLAQAPPSLSRSVMPSSPTSRAPSADPILARNPFDHVTGPLVAPPSQSSSDANGATSTHVVDVSDPLSAPACEGVDVGAIVASDDADWSFASVEGADKKTRLVRRGGDLGGKKVEFIGWDRMWLSSSEGLCQAKVFGVAKAPVVAPPAPSARTEVRPQPRGAKPLDPDLKKGIRALSATEFDIDRGVLDRILENQAELMRQARIIPVQENGRAVGVKMLGIRPDTLLGVLGMQNEDRLQTINGFEVANPEKALEAYARLRTADKLTIQVNRGGKNMNLDYNIK